MEDAPTVAALLNVWENGRSRSQVDRALSLLALAAGPNQSGTASKLSIGRRDAELLKLRETLFGPQVTGQADCPGCRQAVEFSFDIAEVHSPSEVERPELGEFRFGDCEIQFRLPNTEDIAGLPEVGLEAQKRALVLRCITKAFQQGEPLPATGISDQLVQALSEHMGELDPQGDVRFALSCPHCNHHWQSPLDIASFLWREIQAWAERVLREVHALASAYGWREADILAMSAIRRQAYLELLGP